MSSEETPSVADTLREELEAGEEVTEETVNQEESVNEEIVNEEETVAQEETSDSALTAPQHWPEEARAMFDGQPDEVKEYLLERHKSMEADYTKKTEEVAQFRKAVDPIREQFKAAGLSDADGVGLLMEFHSVYQPYVDALQSDPEKAIKQLAKDYGVNLGEEEYSDPEVKGLKDEIKQLKSELNETRQGISQSNVSSIQQQIDKFKATEIEGKPAYPHYDKLEGIMSMLIQSKQVVGIDTQDTLKKAYDKALRLDDDLYNETLQQKRKEALEEEQRKKQEAAKIARTRTTAKGRALPDTEEDEPSTMRDELTKQFQEAQRA